MGSLSDDSLLQEFVAESKEHLSSIEPDLLTLEKGGGNMDEQIINRVFRAIHSIKGASGFFGLVNLKNLSHTMESVLMLIRDGQLSPTPEIMDPLLAGVDKLNIMLDDIQESETVACQDLIVRLEIILGKPDAGAGAEPASGNTATAGIRPVDRTLLDSAIHNGQRLFAISIHVDQDLTEKQRTPLEVLDQLVSIGLVIDSYFDTSDFPDLSNCLDASLTLKIIYASVLERDLVAMAANLPDNQVVETTIEQIMSSANSAASTPQTVEAPAPVQPAPKPLAEATPAPEPVAEAASATEAPKPAPAKEASEAKAKTTASAGDESIRVRVDLLNKLMDLAGEMVLSRNQLLRALNNLEGQNAGLASITQHVDLITSELQEHIMQTRMQPVGSIFGKLPRIIRDIAKQLNKEIEFQTSGEDVELDKSILESLSDPLTHLIRNCCDHAIEMPAERVEKGKPAQGTVWLRAYHEGGQIHISITDDGRGIDHNRIAKKAMDHGLIREADIKKMSPQEMVNLIFLPGLSTAEKVSDISGRGVGMDVVRTNIEKVGGHISIETQMGEGTTILLRLPLTLAIIPSLIVGTAGQRFAVPQVNLVELVCVKAADISSKIEKIGTASVLRLRGKLLPLVRLSDVLELSPKLYEDDLGNPKRDRRKELADARLHPGQPDVVHPIHADLNKRTDSRSDYNIMVLKVGPNQFGLVVDELFDMEEIVVKPLSSFIQQCKCFAGATIMGDGQVAMILDGGGILNSAKLSFTELQAEENRQKQQRAAVESGEQRAILLFKNAAEEIFAIPLSSVLRLERFEGSNIERLGGKEFITDDEKSTELLRLENTLPVKPCVDKNELFLILPKAGEGRIGIIASEIVDTMEFSQKLDRATLTDPSVLGTAVIHGHLTLFVDPDKFVESNSRGLAYAS